MGVGWCNGGCCVMVWMVLVFNGKAAGIARVGSKVTVLSLANVLSGCHSRFSSEGYNNYCYTFIQALT